MKEFDSFEGLAGEFIAKAAEAAVIDHEILEKSAEIIQKRAKAKISRLQPEAPPFAEWEPLEESTIERKENTSLFAMNSEGNPLLLTGEMRDSIEKTVLAGEAHVGSDNDKAVWHELGTSKVPPRSFLGGAAAESGRRIADMAGAATMRLFLVAQPFGKLMEIDE